MEVQYYVHMADHLRILASNGRDREQKEGTARATKEDATSSTRVVETTEAREPEKKRRNCTEEKVT